MNDKTYIVSISYENVELLRYMANRYNSTPDDLVDEAIREYFSEELYELRQAEREGATEWTSNRQ